MSDERAELAKRLRLAPFEPLGRFADASNATLLVRLTDRDPRSLEELVAEFGREPQVEDLDAADLAVYKPQRGETPLWDYPTGTLHLREVAAHEVSAALGWGIVPLTVLRREAPFGIGSVQRFVPHDLDLHYFRLRELGDAAVLDALRRLTVFDLVINNGDRKGGHVLLEQSAQDRAGEGPVRGVVRGVDHGLSLHLEPKLRTVLWDFAGQPVPDELRAAVAELADALDGALGSRLAGLLTDDELTALGRRAEFIAGMPLLPGPRSSRDYPWPPL